MNKKKKIKAPVLGEVKNPVAKYAYQFNKAQVFKDKSKYQRHNKHKGKEPFPMMFWTSSEKAPFYSLPWKAFIEKTPVAWFAGVGGRDVTVKRTEMYLGNSQ